MSRVIKYDRYFRLTTISNKAQGITSVGLEEYDSLDFSDNNIHFVASLFVEGDRVKAIEEAIRIIESEAKEGETVTLRMTSGMWRRWRDSYPNMHIRKNKRSRAGWTAMLAHDALVRGNTCINRIR